MTTLELLLNRIRLLPDRTIGSLTVGDWSCWTLEDKVREIEGVPVDQWKIRGITAIPRGRYRVTLKDSPHFGPDTITLHGVDGYQFIRMHGGNTPGDTEGCLLVGMDYRAETQTIGNCAPALAALKEIIKGAIAAGQEVWITVK